MLEFINSMCVRTIYTYIYIYIYIYVYMYNMYEHVNMYIILTCVHLCE